MQRLAFRYSLKKIQRFEWDGNQKHGSNGAPESFNFYEQLITLKNLSNIILGSRLCCWLISYAFLNKKTKRIILNKYSPLQVASDKW